MTTLFAFLLPPIGYFFGSIPFGFLIGRAVGTDVRAQGSKNIGATNVSRVLGKKWGLLTLILDCLKGYLPMLFASWLLPDSYRDKELIIAVTGVMAILGHMFSAYLNFKGGKGVATALGVFLFLSPPAVGICLLVFVVSVAVSGFVSVGSLLASAFMPLLLYFFGAPRVSIGAAVMVAALIWLKHNENIDRLRKGEEKSWRKKKVVE